MCHRADPGMLTVSREVDLTHSHLSLACVLVLAVSTLNLSCQRSNQYVPPPPPQVTVAQPVQRPVTDYVEYTGTTEAIESVMIRARVKGFLDSVNFEFGQEVKAGAPLYRIDPRPFVAKVDQAKAAVVQSLAEMVNAQARYERVVPLVKSGAVSPEEAGERKAEMHVAKAAITAAEADERVAQLDLSYTDIRSPIDGRVGKTFVTVGNLVGNTNDATHLTTVIKYDPIYVNFTISERDLLIFMGDNPMRSEKETKILLRRANDTEFMYEGRSDYADLAVDEGTGTFAVRAVFDNPDRTLLPGLFVVLRIPVREIEDAVLINEQAVGADQAGRYVLVVKDDNIVVRKSVRLGAKSDGLQVVLEGVEPDDWVIINGIQRARPGAKVDSQRTKTEPPQAETESPQTETESPQTEIESPRSEIESPRSETAAASQ
jgi:RND family efflux transporter MFP subunit